MKASIYQKDLQIDLTTAAESWRQNTTVGGTITLTNLAANKLSSFPQVQVVIVNQKQVKSGIAAAISTVVAQFKGETQELAAAQKASWNFNLKLNDQITDKYFAPYLIFGAGDDLAGRLALKVQVAEVWEAYLKAWQDRLRFQAKEVRLKDKALEIKLLPPKSRDYAHLKKLTALWEKDEQNTLHATYKVVMQELGMHDGTADLSEVKKNITQDLTPRQYEFSPGMINTEAFVQAAEEISDQLKMKKF